MAAGEQPRMDLERAVTLWLRALDADRASTETIKKYDLVLRHFLAHVQASQPSPKLRDLTAEALREWIVALRVREDGGKPISQNSVADYVTVVKAFANWLGRNGYLRESPVAKVKGPKRIPPVPGLLSQEQVQALLYQAEHGRRNRLRDVAMLLFALDTGVRVSELAALNRDDLDLKHRIDQGRATVQHGKGDKRRDVFLSLPTVKTISAYLAERDRRRNRAQPVRGEALFTGEDGGRLTAFSIRSWLKRLARRAGITERVHPHQLRHTFATRLIANGANVFAVQGLMGHSKLTTTQIYVNLASTDMSETHALASPVVTWGLSGTGKQRPGRRSA